MALVCFLSTLRLTSLQNIMIRTPSEPSSALRIEWDMNPFFCGGGGLSDGELPGQCPYIRPLYEEARKYFEDARRPMP